MVRASREEERMQLGGEEEDEVGERGGGRERERDRRLRQMKRRGVEILS
jgi:hypothetical protein